MIRLILDFKDQFPEKLYDVVCDGGLFRWNRNGSVSVLDEETFVDNVMKWYPGFLQISSFQNLKRLFREYGFDRNVNQNDELEFSHPMFIYGRRELLSQIKTRRKSFKTPQNHSDYNGSLIIEAEENRRYSSRSRSKTKRFRPDGSSTPNKLDLEGGGDVLSHNNAYIIKTPINTSCAVNDVPETEKMKQPNDTKNKNFEQLMRIYAEKEFSEEEYTEWLKKQRTFDAAKELTVEEPAEPSEKSIEYWWLYESQPGDIVPTKQLRQSSTEDSFSTPCGFCKCCSAISNYVHLFGEVPENIQVIDCLEEVVTTSENENCYEVKHV